MSKKLKVLHVINSLNYGGAERFILNVYEKMDMEKIQFDFLVKNKNNEEIEKMVVSKGSKIYKMPNFPRHIIKNFIATKKFILNANYDVVHVHANSLIYVLPIFVALKNKKIKKVVVHSHNTDTKNKFVKYLHMLNKKILARIENIERVACSKEAGKWMFGDKRYVVINNGIDFDKFLYNVEIRERYRKELGLEKKFVVGNIGRLTYQKNHMFMIEMLPELKKCNADIKLVLVGDGELKEQLMDTAKKLGVEEDILFMGNRSDVGNTLSMFDVFFFPSLYEGFPITLLEAQANGLLCIVSDTITQDVNLTGNVEYISLDSSIEKWENKLLTWSKRMSSDEIKQKMCSYDIHRTIELLEEVYFREK